MPPFWLQVYATRAIKPGEELVADGIDERDGQVCCAVLCCAVLCDAVLAVHATCQEMRGTGVQRLSMRGLCLEWSCLRGSFLLLSHAVLPRCLPVILWLTSNSTTAPQFSSAPLHFPWEMHLPAGRSGLPAHRLRLVTSFHRLNPYLPPNSPVQHLLLDALASRLIASGWRCHLLDAFWLRTAKLAQQRCRQLAACSSSSGAACRLRRALRQAVAQYYDGQQPSGSGGSRDAGGTGAGGDGTAGDGGCDSGGSSEDGRTIPADKLQLIDAALAASARAHRPPCSATSLSCREAPPLDQQFRPVERRELPPLCRSCDFSGLPEDVLGALDGAPGGPPLEEVRAAV